MSESPSKQVERDSRSPSPRKEEPRSRSGTRSRSRSYSRSRSRSHKRSYSRSRSRSHRRSRSRSRGGSRSRRRYTRSRSRSYGRRYSRSPMSHRRRHIGDRLNPTPSKCLGVFGLSLYTTERELRAVFEKYGHIDSINIVLDQKTGRSRGFGFVYFEHQDDAIEAKEKCNGKELDGRRMRVDFSITKRAHTPTPGVYVGKPYEPPRHGYRGGRSPSPYGRHRRSPSPYHRGSRRSPSPYSRRRSPSPYYRDRRY